MRRLTAFLVGLCAVTLTACNPFGSASAIDPNFHPGFDCVRLVSPPVSWWDMDSVDNGQVADIWGSSPALFSGAPSNSVGKVFNGWNFSLGGASLSIASTDALELSTAITVAAWVNPTANEQQALRTAVGKWKHASTVGGWESFNGAALTGQPKGMRGATFDGRYVYYVPWIDAAADSSGKMVRYDTQAPFTATSSWEEFDTGPAAPVGISEEGFIGAVFDGRYVYYAPLHRTSTNGRVVRYDTT